MQNEEIFSGIFYSADNGAARDVQSKAISSLNGKTFQLFVDVSEVDSNTRLKVKAQYSADGSRWVDASATTIDTGSGTDAAVQVYAGDNGSDLIGAFLRFTIIVEERTAVGSRLSLTATARVVVKPF